MRSAAGRRSRAFSARRRRVATRHGVSIANVATRWVLEHPAVAAVIVGARLGEREHRADNLQLFAFALDEDDRAALDAALGGDHAHARRLRRRISPAALPDRLGRSQPPSRAPCRRYFTADAVAGPARTGCASIPAACGNRSPATAARCASATACWSAAPRPRTARRGGLPRRSRRAGHLHPRQDRGEPRGARRPRSRTSCARGSICGTPTIGSRCRAPTAAVFGDDPAGQYAARGRRLVGDYLVEIEAEAVVG